MTLVRMNRPTLVRDLAHQAFLRNFTDSYYDNTYSNENLPVEYNVSEEDTVFKLELAIPGLSKDDLVVEIENGVLTIATKETEDGEERKGFSARKFSKRFKLSEKVNQAEISASSKNGILNVVLPKVESAIKKPARQIEIA